MNPITEIGAFAAKTHLSELLEKVSRGKTFCITKHGHPVAELRPVPTARQRPCFGADKGKVEISEDFDAPVPEMQDYLE